MLPCKKQKIHNIANEVLRGKLYVGCAVAASNINVSHPQCKAVVSLSTQGPTKCGYSRFDGIVYHHITIEDCSDALLIHHFNIAVNFIHEHISKGDAVFVHCRAGISRSVTICMAYLIKYFFLNVDQAFSVIQCVRPFIQPNDGFMDQLKHFEAKQ